MVKFKIGKLSKAVAPLAGIGGFFAGVGGIEGLQENVTAIIHRPKIPAINELLDTATDPVLWGFIILAISGYIAKHIPITYVPTAGRIMEKAGAAAAFGSLGGLLLIRLHNPDGISRSYGVRNISGRTSTAGRLSYPINGTRAGQLRPQA